MPTHPALYLEGLPLSALLSGLEAWIMIRLDVTAVTQDQYDTAPEWIAAYKQEIIRRCAETSLGGSE